MKNWICNWYLIIVTTATLLMTICIFCSFRRYHTSQPVDNSPVTSLDLNRYLGRWYEIARYDHRFERGQSHCTADYILNGDGTIRVLNMGMKNGKWQSSEGTARLTDTTGVLEVSFFGPFYSDYRVLMVAPDYSYALVGGGNGEYLWLLARTPEPDEDICHLLVHEAKRRGYDTRRLIWVEQEFDD